MNSQQNKVTPQEEVPVIPSNNISKSQASPSAKQRWKNLSHMFKFVRGIQKIEVEPISDEQQLQKSLRKRSIEKKNEPKRQDSFLKKVQNHGFKPQAYKDYFTEQNTKNDFDMMISQEKNIKLFFECISSGSPEDIQRAIFYISHDPKQHLYSPGHPDLVVNQRFKGQTPLYKAAGIGSIELVQALIDRGANLDISSIVNTNTQNPIQEGNLELVCRLGYVKLFKLFWGLKQWDKDVVNSCLKRTRNKEILQILQKKQNKNKNKCFFLW